MKGYALWDGGIMRQRIFAIMICAILLVTGCSAGTPDSVASEKIQSEAKKAEASKTRDVKEKKKESAEDTSKEASGADKDKTAEKTSKDSAASEKKKAEEKKTEEKTAEKTSKESAASEKEKAGEKDAEKEESEKKEDRKKEEESEKKKETKKEEESEKKEKDLKQESKEKYANDYIPEGFTPYGSYVLVYDSGYEVKTRLSKVGLTYYYESEEFLFTLDKNLPDMTREVAHILFNTAAPMDPSNTGGEEFPFWEGFVIYINLDDGRYYEVPSYSLDLNGRVFARDIFETFRQKWEGSF